MISYAKLRKLLFELKESGKIKSNSAFYADYGVLNSKIASIVKNDINCDLSTLIKVCNALTALTGKEYQLSDIVEIVYK